MGGEERVDDAIDPNLGDRWFKLIRRSYSISSRVLDDHGYLVDEGGLDEVDGAAWAAAQAGPPARHPPGLALAPSPSPNP